MEKQELGERAAALLEMVRSYGSDAEDPRDAAHEAFHALEMNVPKGKWTRATIDAYTKKCRTGERVRSEVMARAVEQIVCQRLGYTTQGIVHWAMIACMEAVKFHDRFLDYNQAVTAIRNAHASVDAQKWADKVMALIEEKKVKVGDKFALLDVNRKGYEPVQIAKVGKKYLYVTGQHAKKPFDQNTLRAVDGYGHQRLVPIAKYEIDQKAASYRAALAKHGINLESYMLSELVFKVYGALKDVLPLNDTSG